MYFQQASPSCTDSTNGAACLTVGNNMSNVSSNAIDKLWDEYGRVFRDFDDLTLARWMAQTLGQIEGRVWRLSHPLMGAYRLAAYQGNDRQIWHKRLATVPSAYSDAPCCRAPLLPMLTRDVIDSGLVCQHCGGTAVPFDEIHDDMRYKIQRWAEEYAPVHAIAHQEEGRYPANEYERMMDEAAHEATRLLGRLAKEITSGFLEIYPAIVWEDQDECLGVRPEDIPS